MPKLLSESAREHLANWLEQRYVMEFIRHDNFEFGRLDGIPLGYRAVVTVKLEPIADLTPTPLYKTEATV
jgi:hypothetical protein